MSRRKKFSNKHARQDRLEMPAASSSASNVLAGISLIVVLSFFVYLPSLNGGFIWDDYGLLAENQLIKSAGGLYKLWCTTETVDYWPVTYTTFWIEWRLWGTNTIGYHVTNLILHVVEALLIWIVLRKMAVPGAFLAAVIFAVHPVNVESVAWIASRKSLMAMLFFLLSILCYLEYLTRARLRLAAKQTPLAAKQTPPTVHCPQSTFSTFILHPSSFSIWYWLSLAAFVLAMLSKGSVAVLPVIILGIIWWQRPLNRRDVVQIVPFFVVAVALTLVNVWFQTKGTEAVFRNAGFIERMLGAGCVIWFYLYKALLPLNLAWIYPQWNIETDKLLWWLPILAAATVTVVFWIYRKSWSRPFLLAWGFFCVALLPVMGFADVYFMRYSLVADHYQHLALIGAIALISAGWSRWHQGSFEAMKRAAIVVAVLAVGILAVLTYHQSGLYSDEITLYQDTLKKNPDCWMAYNNMGNRFLETGRIQEAVEYFQRALRVKADHVEALNNLGNALFQLGRPKDAITYFEKALSLKSEYPEAHYNLGNVLLKEGRVNEAIEHYQKAVQIKPDYTDAQNNLGNILLETGRPKEAIEHYRQAIRLNPDLATAYYNMAWAYDKLGRSSEAVPAAQKALELARSQGQMALAGQIEDWLNSHSGQ